MAVKEVIAIQIKFLNSLRKLFNSQIISSHHIALSEQSLFRSQLLIVLLRQYLHSFFSISLDFKQPLDVFFVAFKAFSFHLLQFFLKLNQSVFNQLFFLLLLLRFFLNKLSSFIEVSLVFVKSF